MLNTYENQPLSFSYDSTVDSTVHVSPGVVRLGNVIMPFRGDSIRFSEMIDMSADNTYRYSVLSIYNYDSATNFTSPDLTCVTTDFSSILCPVYPSIDNTDIHPIGLFLFNTDKTTTNLISAFKVE